MMYWRQVLKLLPKYLSIAWPFLRGDNIVARLIGTVKLAITAAKIELEQEAEWKARSNTK